MINMINTAPILYLIELEDLVSRLHGSVCLKSSFLRQKLTAFSVKLLPQKALSLDIAGVLDPPLITIFRKVILI